MIGQADPDPFTDVIFMFEGIGWLKWLVASFFFALGLFAGWWQWGYRRQEPAAGEPTPPPQRPLPQPILSKPETGDQPETAEFGFVYDSRPDEIDDLRRIRGIGKALREKLHRLGIYRFEQIADWGEDQIDAVAKNLHLGQQIEKGEWVEQAKSLQRENRKQGRLLL